MEFGKIRLENTEVFPFNNSLQTVALQREQKDTDYLVLTELLGADGDIGEIRITGKAANGFQIAFTGSAASAEIRWQVTGGAE